MTRLKPINLYILFLCLEYVGEISWNYFGLARKMHDRFVHSLSSFKVVCYLEEEVFCYYLEFSLMRIVSISFVDFAYLIHSMENGTHFKCYLNSQFEQNEN